MCNFCSKKINIFDILPCDIIKFWFGLDDLNNFFESEENLLTNYKSKMGLLWFNIRNDISNEEANKNRMEYNKIMLDCLQAETIIDSICNNENNLNRVWFNNSVTSILAQIIVLDQFPRNLYNDERQFIYDDKALKLCYHFLEMKNDNNEALYKQFPFHVIFFFNNAFSSC